MATKPSSVPVWNTGGDNNTEPSSGKKITGWQVGEQPPSDYFNWLQKLYGEWCQYLSDGAFTGNHSVSGALSALSTLAVTGATTLTGALTAAAATFSGLITANAGLTAGSNQHITVSGTGEFKHGDRVRVISPVNGVGSSWSFNSIGYMVSTASGDLVISVPVQEGERVKSVTFARFGDGAADLTATTVTVFKSDGTSSNIGTGSVTNPAASWSDTTIDITDTTITSGQGMHILLTANAANVRVAAIRLTYDRP